MGSCDTLEVVFERVGRLRLPFIRYTRRCRNVRLQVLSQVLAVELGRYLASLSRPHPPSTLLDVDFRDVEDGCDPDSNDCRRVVSSTIPQYIISLEGTCLSPEGLSNQVRSFRPRLISLCYTRGSDNALDSD